eukprot:3767355-Prymnesium_polylepis.4
MQEPILHGPRNGQGRSWVVCDCMTLQHCFDSRARPSFTTLTVTYSWSGRHAGHVAGRPARHPHTNE